MNTYKVIEKKKNERYDGVAGNNSWDLILEDAQGRKFRTEAFMCVGQPPSSLIEGCTIHASVLKPIVL